MAPPNRKLETSSSGKLTSAPAAINPIAPTAERR
jgi:hypothetical protein